MKKCFFIILLSLQVLAHAITSEEIVEVINSGDIQTLSEIFTPTEQIENNGYSVRFTTTYPSGIREAVATSTQNARKASEWILYYPLRAACRWENRESLPILLSFLEREYIDLMPLQEGVVCTTPAFSIFTSSETNNEQKKRTYKNIMC